MRTVLLIVGGLLLQTGCGESVSSHPTVKLAGQVSVAGQPIDEGRISFFPVTKSAKEGVNAADGGGQADSCPIAAGGYQVARVPKGKVLVTFSAIRETGKIVHEHDHDFPERVSIIPPKCQAGIEIQMDADNAALDFDLK